MIDIVHSNYNIDTTYIDESLLDKFITSFDGVIRENTKQLCYNHEKDILNQINNNSRISFVYVETLNVKDPQFINYLIDDLNSIKHSVKIRLDLFDCDSSELAKYFNNKNSNITLVVKDNNSNMFIIENENHIELSISPFNNTEMICLYEKYYLPTSFTISYFQKGMNDFTYFKHINTFKISNYYMREKIYMKLPITTQTFDFDVYQESTIDDIQIINWKDLNSLKKINHHGNLDIPYPQIKYENNLNKSGPASCGDISMSIVPIICFLSSLYLFLNIILYITKASYSNNDLLSLLYDNFTCWAHSISII
ncbi:hypothetical protein QTN25_002056 [Entamoeba marina]